MDPPENSGNRFGRTIWTVWGYLSGAVARYLRPEVTEDGNQSVRTRTDDIGLKSTVNKIDREVKANNSENEGKNAHQNESIEIKSSPSKEQVASAQWENTDVVKDDNNDELEHVHTTKKQIYHCAVWSTDNERRTGDAHAEKETVSDEVPAEKGSANSEFEERETAQELEETEKTEQKDGHNEECDQNHEDEKCVKRREDADNTDLTVQTEQDVELEKQMNMTDHRETECTAGFKLIDEHLIGEKENVVDQKDQEKAENDEELRLDSPDLLPQMKPFAEEANALSELERLEANAKYSDEIADVSRNEVEEMMHETGSATEQDEENRTAQELEEHEQLEQKDVDTEDEECDRIHEDERCVMAREDLDNADTMVQSQLYAQEQEKIRLMDHTETEDAGGFKLADEHPVDEKEKHVVDQNDQEIIENDEDQETESQVQDLLSQMEYFTQEADDFAKLDRLEVITKYSDEFADVSKNEVEEMMHETGSATEQDEENRTAQELEEHEQLEQKDVDTEDEECDRIHEDERCVMAREDLDNADVMVQSQLYGQDVEQEKISLMDHAETEDAGGFKLADEHPVDEKEKHVIEQKDQEIIENDEDQETESQVQDLLSQMEYFTEEANDVAEPERLKSMENYSDEIDKFSKEEVEEMMLGTEQDEDTTESKRDITKNELTEPVETLQRVSEELSEKNASNEEPELKMTTVDETVDPLEDTLLSDSERDTPENTPETGTWSPVETEGMFSDLMVCEFPGELRKGPETALAETDLGCFEEIKTNLGDPLAEEQAEREAVVAYSVEHSETLKAFQTERDTETVIEPSGTTENQEVDKTEVSLKEHVELRTELIVKTIETEISSEDEEAFETESRSPIVRNVTLQPHELLEFTEGQRKSSQGTIDPFNETQGNSSVSEIAGTAKIEHVAEDQTDAKPVSTMSLSPVVLLEESLTEEQEILETDVAKTALEYVEEITNQVLKEMTETEFNVEQKTEPLVRLSTEELGDAEYQGAAQCVSSDVFVLEEERKLLGETMDSRVEMETTSSEVVKQNVQHISSPECETTEADGRHEHIQKSTAGETVSSSQEDLMEVNRSGMKRVFDQVSTDLPQRKTDGKLDLYLQAFEDSSLDFTLQKARIAVKNPQVRPPKDPRKLLFKASLDPLLPQTSPRAQKVEVSAPSKGVIGFKLPGLGAGLPVLRKTEFGQKAREGGEAERTLQTPTSVAVTEDSVKQEQVPAKPKWTPPKHPGMGSPFMMAELKSKLKKPVQE
ncbi:uncharacterized protein [Garra rufa]|uniref:uncharacterized protein isoform X2 n=1 Tax=Garra rufa TaxID=137080 RepID=UPI003CCEF6AC